MEQHPVAPVDARRFWIKLFMQPLLLLAAGIILLIGLGVAQRMGVLSSGGGARVQTTAASADALYICPMMCTPPRSEPGRCPVCGMELVPTTAGVGDSDSQSVQIDSAARRVANIRTVQVTSTSMQRTIRAIGELAYDEGGLRTISAYVDGRLERLYADYTGVVVKKDDHLAMLYSPRLYSSQVEVLLARQALEQSQSSTLQRTLQSNQELYASAKQRLIELGMTESQIAELERAGQANSRLQLCAPIGGTVIEKFAVEGQYVKEGDPIYRLADLSSVWLMLELFPEDAAMMRYGQKVEAEVQSLPGRKFTGRVAFIDPNVDPQTRTVGIRVVIPNDGGLLRVGDYAKSTIEAPLNGGPNSPVYDPELAGKWISPRHPHVVQDSPGVCPICGMPLVPASQFGYSDMPVASDVALVVPRDAVLSAGANSVLYVETVPGRFEIRRVVLGPSVGDQMVIHSGVELGEQVATRGNFLIDSQMQLAGNPSLIDPVRYSPAGDSKADVIATSLAALSPENRRLADQQGICPVTEAPLGSMGMPKIVDLGGRTVFICCESCREPLLAEPDKYLFRLASRPAERTLQSTAPSDDLQMDLPEIGGIELLGPAPDAPLPADTGTPGESAQ
jgi:Cu(I)/Ag(I) efflux system membrane fusion protein